MSKKMINLTLTLILILQTLSFKVSYSAKILGYFPIPSISHQVAFRPLMKELAKRGHTVTVVTTDPEFKDQTPPNNYKEIDVHDISYSLWRKGFVEHINGDADDFQAMKAIGDININIVENQLNNTDFNKIINGGEKSFDLVITEVWSTVAIAVGVKLKAPVIQISSLAGLGPVYEVYGVPNHRLIYPEFNRRKLNNLSVFDKIKELYYGEKYNRIYSVNFYKEEVFIRKVFGEDMMSSDELRRVPELLFLNVHSVWVQNRPVPPNVVYIGGIHQNPRKELPLDLKNYLDSSRNGVIYMSFGTNVDTKLLDPARIKMFCDVFSQMPYDVLWKWNDDSLPWKPDNVKISKWLPQSDLLRHPKIKVFITQGGLQSTDEAITAGVPLIAFPMLGDQAYNAEMYEYLKIGVRKVFASITESSLLETITHVINDGSYQENIKKLNSTIRDQPQTSLERAVWWTEYVLRHGGAKHLRSPMASVTWTEYLMLDVIAVVLGISAVFVTCLIYVVKKVLGTICFETNKLKKS